MTKTRKREVLKPSTASMRRKKQREYDAGYRRSTVALSPTSLDVVERIKGNFGLPSREATINAVFELINSDMFLWAEFMSPRHAPKPEPVGESDPGQ
ncbi:MULTISPECIES: hypothetical protein [Sphingomonas]|jgi:hypothetical protein|uniref:Uncharacterized protein n=1 Tax=Sphingomonas abaci TaxID=237611 RepID=A0A7W7AMK6_9SPHN|nr:MULTISPECIES: hypothetical protein [Sphingomonas]MBB4619809.1 hypothetical protein [Sphingomonas abaci]